MSELASVFDQPNVDPISYVALVRRLIYGMRHGGGVAVVREKNGATWQMRYDGYGWPLMVLDTRKVDVVPRLAYRFTNEAKNVNDAAIQLTDLICGRGGTRGGGMDKVWLHYRPFDGRNRVPPPVDMDDFVNESWTSQMVNIDTSSSKWFEWNRRLWNQQL